MVKTRGEARLPATIKTPNYQSATPRAGNDVTPPRENRSVSGIDDETSAGSKSAQDLDCNYAWERSLSVLLFGWFLLVVGSTTRQRRRMFHPDPEICVWLGG